MNELEKLCGLPREQAESASYDVLRDACQNVSSAFGLSGLELGLLLVLAIVAALVLFGLRHRYSEPTDVMVGNTLEGALFAAIGFYAGSTFGLIVAQIVPAGFLAWLLGATGAVALVFIGFGLALGEGTKKPFAVIEGLALAAVLAAMVVACVVGAGGTGSQYETYLNVVPIGLGLLGATDGILAAVFRAHKPLFGWLLVAVNASWGFLGNILGLATHVASYNCYPGNGQPESTRRKFYTRYGFGLSLLENKSNPAQRYAFTGGGVVSSQGGDFEKHEAIHVRQHLIAGPVFVVSHGVWDVIAALLVAPVGAATKGKSLLGYAITEMAYYNNPWEIHAYSYYLSGRDWNANRTLLFRSPLDKIFMVVWIALVSAVLVILTIAWAA